VNANLTFYVDFVELNLL